METNQNRFSSDSDKEVQRANNFTNPDGSERNEIESDEDTLEPFDDGNEHREINADDAADLFYWANEFQISVADLKAALLLNGNSVREIKKYLSV